MRRPRFEACSAFRWLAVALIPIAVASMAIPFSSPARAAAKGKIVLAWHAGFASRWLDPQEHDGTATPDNFMTALHDALIKNQGTELYDHPALAERFAIAADAKSATFTLRKGIKFHNGEPVTPQDVKFSYENYRGAKADVFKKKTERVEIVDDRTVRFIFKEPFLDFATLFGTANVAAPGWVVPEKYYKQVGADGFKQKPIGAGPYKLLRLEPGVKIEMEAFDGYYRPVNVKQLVMISVPEPATRVAMLERGEADIIYFVPGELINKVGKLPGVTLAPVLSGSLASRRATGSTPTSSTRSSGPSSSGTWTRPSSSCARPVIRTDSTWTGSRPCPRSTRGASASSRSSSRSASAAGSRPWSGASSSSACRAGSKTGPGSRSSSTAPGSGEAGRSGTKATSSAAASMLATASA